MVSAFRIRLAQQSSAISSDLGAGLEGGHVPVGQVLRDLHPAAAERNPAGEMEQQTGSEA